MNDLEQWADDNGYQRYRCSVCGQIFYDDGEPECCPRDEEEDE